MLGRNGPVTESVESVLLNDACLQNLLNFAVVDHC